MVQASPSKRTYFEKYADFLNIGIFLRSRNKSAIDELESIYISKFREVRSSKICWTSSYFSFSKCRLIIIIAFLDKSETVMGDCSILTKKLRKAHAKTCPQMACLFRTVFLYTIHTSSLKKKIMVESA